MKSQLPVRMAVTGRRSGLPLFEPMAELERDEVLARLRPRLVAGSDRTRCGPRS